MLNARAVVTKNNKEIKDKIKYMVVAICGKLARSTKSFGGQPEIATWLPVRQPLITS